MPEKHTSPKFAFVAGTVLLDVVSTITDNRDKRDSLGPTTINFGGVAYNVAVNLKRLNVTATLMTALNDTPISQMVINELDYNGIRLHLKKEKSLRDGIYSGHFLEGEEVSSVWDNILEAYDFSEAFIRKGMKNASCAILSNCLSVTTLNRCIKMANELKIPVFVSGACLGESHKFLELKGNMDCIFCNHLEFEAVASKAQNINTPKDFVTALKAPVVMTKSDQGVEVFTKEGQSYCFPVETVSVTGNTLGAGDLFMSATIKHYCFQGQKLKESVASSLEIAAKILDRVDANIGRQRALEENISDISRQAEKDKLTSLLNRNGLEKTIENLVQKQKPFFFVLLDIDNFKSFNDTFGHDVGDKVLSKVGGALKDAIRTKDIVGRWGGEEFLSLIVTPSKETALKVAERMRAAVESLCLEETEQKITISSGISSFDGHQKWGTSLKKADGALYEAKKQGRNQAVFENCG